jgi:hypothetical protein
MTENNRKSYEITRTWKNGKKGSLTFGLAGLGVNTTKKDNRENSRIKDDISR